MRADTPLTLTMEDLSRLRSLNDPISLEEVVAIYLPLSRLLALYVAATQGLYKATQRFLGAEGGKVPYIIGVAGSVSAGKSTLSRVMQALLSRWPNTPKVELVTTDGFLHPNACLKSEGLMEKKGFPESYDGGKLICFLSDVKAGKRNVRAPVYSHVTYDVLPGESIIVDRPDILIVEGLNVLLPNRPAQDGRAIPFVSDFFDFSIYLHAAENDLESWFISRFMRLRDTAFRDPAILFQEIRRSRRRRGGSRRARYLDADQSSQSARKHAADNAPREPRLDQGAKPHHRGSRATEALGGSRICFAKKPAANPISLRTGLMRQKSLMNQNANFLCEHPECKVCLH